MKKITSPKEMAAVLGLSLIQAQEAYFKAEILQCVEETMRRKRITHVELAKRTGIPRSAVTGIINGSLLSVSLDRHLRMAAALGIEVVMKVKKTA